MNVIHLLCASASAHIFFMFKNVNVFPRVNVLVQATCDKLWCHPTQIAIIMESFLSDF